MKFAHEFKTALVREGFPQEWVDLSIPYGQLKKVLKKVSIELQEMGLGPAILSSLGAHPDKGVVGYRYDIEGILNSSLGAQQSLTLSGDQKEFRPKLKLFFQGDLAVDATLSPDTRAYLENLKSEPSSESSENSGIEDDGILAREGFLGVIRARRARSRGELDLRWPVFPSYPGER